LGTLRGLRPFRLQLSAALEDWRPAATRATLARRAELRADIRAFMARRGVLEVDTPLIGSAAPAERGLQTFSVSSVGHLTPSPEHALKRLLAAGAGPIYQLGPVFRAGEAGRWHNPEFCMLEWYRPQASIDDIMTEVEALVGALAGVTCAPRRAYRDVFAEVTQLDPIECATSELAQWALERGLAPDGGDNDPGRAFWLDLIMSLGVQPTLGRNRPLCVTDFPAEDAVLVETRADDARIAARFECFWQGIELANGAQELTDAETARERMKRELRAREQAGAALPRLDEKLLAAMTAGLPRSAGVALGVDRLLALICGFDALAPVLAFDWARR
jgi:lysyl-tRNA synthetase class 2